MFSAAHTMAAVIYGDCWSSSVGHRGKSLLTNITCLGTHKREAVNQDSGQVEQAPTKNVRFSKIKNQ